MPMNDDCAATGWSPPPTATIATQHRMRGWHDDIGEPPIAHALLDRLVHEA